MADMNGLVPEVDQYDPQRTAIIAVNRTGCVGKADTLPEGETRARTDLHLEARRNLDGDTCRDKPPFPRRQSYTLPIVIGEIGSQIGSRSAFGLIGW